MQKYILVSGDSFMAYYLCKSCKDVTNHYINFISYDAKNHTIQFAPFCSICLEEAGRAEEELKVPVQECTIKEWIKLIDIDEEAEDCTNN